MQKHKLETFEYFLYNLSKSVQFNGHNFKCKDGKRCGKEIL